MTLNVRSHLRWRAAETTVEWITVFGPVCSGRSLDQIVLVRMSIPVYKNANKAWPQKTSKGT